MPTPFMPNISPARIPEKLIPFVIGTHAGRIEIHQNAIEVYLDGYGVQPAVPNYGAVVEIESYQSEANVMIRKDINVEETELQSLEGAREGLRLPDPDGD